MHQNNNNNNENATSFDDYIKKQKIIIAACAVSFALNVAALATDYARIPGDSEVGLFQSCYTFSTGGKVCYSEVGFSDSEGCGVGLHLTNIGRMGGIMAVLNVSFVCALCLIRILNPTFAVSELREKKKLEDAQNGIATDGAGNNNDDNDNNGLAWPKIACWYYQTSTRFVIAIFEFLAFMCCVVLFAAPLCSEGHPTLVAAGFTPGPSFILFGLLFFLTMGFFHCWEKNQPDPAVAPANNNNNNNTNGHNGNTNHHTNNDNNHNEMQQQQHPHHYQQQQQQQPPHQEYNPQYYFGAPTNNNNNNTNNDNTSYPPPPPSFPPPPPPPQSGSGPGYPPDSAAIRFAGFNESRGQ